MYFALLNKIWKKINHIFFFKTIATISTIHLCFCIAFFVRFNEAQPAGIALLGEFDIYSILYVVYVRYCGMVTRHEISKSRSHLWYGDSFTFVIIVEFLPRFWINCMRSRRARLWSWTVHGSRGHAKYKNDGYDVLSDTHMYRSFTNINLRHVCSF